MFDDRTNHTMETKAEVVNDINKRVRERKHASDALLRMDSDTIFNLMTMPNTRASKLTHAWMEDYFHLVGDFNPCNGEIHLEKTDKNAIYALYASEMKEIEDLEMVTQSDNLMVTDTYFYRLWNEQFPHVKIREYKAVTGKCQFCAILSNLRAESKNRSYRKEITRLHSLHKVTYMAERQAYYMKSYQAIIDPDLYMSIILDGMSQNHTKLPWFANQKDFPACLQMHLQGIIEHGQEFVS